MFSTSQSYALIVKDLSKSLSRVASEPVVSRESQYYLENIESITNVDDFVNNRRLFSFAMKAFGLEDLTYAKAFVRKALVEGVEDRAALANQLVDSRLKAFVTTFNFARRGTYTTTFADTQQGTVDRYVRQTLEEEAGQQNEGVRLALYFERKASSITDAYSILGDKALLRVAQTALDIPFGSSGQDIEKQAALIEKRLDISALSNPEDLKEFLTRFTTKWEIANPSNPSTAAGILPVTPLNSSISTVSTDILTAIQSLKTGG